MARTAFDYQQLSVEYMLSAQQQTNEQEKKLLEKFAALFLKTADRLQLAQRMMDGGPAEPAAYATATAS
jgi:hypothetical protein